MTTGAESFMLRLPAKGFTCEGRGSAHILVLGGVVAKFRIRFKPDGSYVIRGTLMSGKQLVKQISLTASSREMVSATMKEVSDALREPIQLPTIAEDRVGKREVN